MTTTRHSFAQFGCAPFADNARTYAYHQWACENDMYPTECNVDLFDCSCPLDDPLVPFTNPIDDMAPWYDPNDPASSEFIGALIQKVTGVADSTIEREPVKAFGDGTILNRARLAGRSFTFELILLSTSCRGADFGVEWLRRVLETDLCGCGPEPCGECFGKRLTIRRNCDDPVPCDTGLRAWESVGVVDGLKITSDPDASCCCVVQTATFVMQSESPYSFGCEEIDCNIVADNVFFDSCFDWSKACDQDCCAEELENKECDRCLNDLNCSCYGSIDPVPASFSTIDPCFCEPLVRRVQACCIDDVGAAGFDTAVKLEVFSGMNITDDVDVVSIAGENIDMDGLAFRDLGLRNLRLSIYENPDNLPCITNKASYDAWCATHPNPRFEIQIPYIPHNAMLTIDGRANRVTLDCDGKCRPFPYSIDSVKGSLFPFITQCQPMMVVVEWDGLNVQIVSEPGLKIPSSATVTTYRRWRS